LLIRDAELNPELYFCGKFEMLIEFMVQKCDKEKDISECIEKYRF